MSLSADEKTAIRDRILKLFANGRSEGQQSRATAGTRVGGLYPLYDVVGVWDSLASHPMTKEAWGSTWSVPPWPSNDIPMLCYTYCIAELVAEHVLAQVPTAGAVPDLSIGAVDVEAG